MTIFFARRWGREKESRRIIRVVQDSKNAEQLSDSPALLRKFDIWKVNVIIEKDKMCTTSKIFEGTV